MSFCLQLALDKKIFDVIHETCCNEYDEVIAHSKDEKEATEVLLKKVTDKIEPVFNSQDFLSVFQSKAVRRGMNSLERAKVTYLSKAMDEVEKTVAAAWKIQMERKRLLQKN
jgi:hypothetical protein